MRCPFCRHPDSRVVDSRTADDGAAIRRRRQCPHCSRRFTTVENASLTVIKRSGVTEPFSRDKVIAGVRKACQGRPVTEDALAQLGQRVEEAVRATGSAELSTHDVGLAILGPLRDLDLVAYLRFASVYKAFESLEDFEAAIAELRQARSSVPGSGVPGEGGPDPECAGEAARGAKPAKGGSASADGRAGTGGPDGTGGADDAPATAAAD
ncbi:transcriptional regulator NrdR [Streptomyces albus]|uniref:transcriptional regulator NrdR n=1 Tax=Streptomyces albus TaxID=1888 RepID=UPI003454ED3D